MTRNTVKHASTVPEQKITRMMTKEIIAKAKAIVSYQAEHSMDSNLEYILKKWADQVPKRPDISSYLDFHGSLHRSIGPVSPKRTFST